MLDDSKHKHVKCKDDEDFMHDEVRCIEVTIVSYYCLRKLLQMYFHCTNANYLPLGMFFFYFSFWMLSPFLECDIILLDML